MSLTVKSCLGVKPFQQQCDDIGGGVLTLRTPNSSCSYQHHTLCCLVFELRDLEEKEEKEKKMNKTLYHSPIHV